MNTLRNRRAFLGEVGRGMVMATIGAEMASELGLSTAFASEEAPLTFGSLERLVSMMQETPANKLLPKLVEQLNNGTELRQLVAAASFANARTFGGEDYIGFHTMMALSPALHMSKELPKESQALPIFKVLYRNTNRIQEHGGRKGEVLHAVAPSESSSVKPTGESLRDAVRSKDVDASEKLFAAIARASADEAFNAVLYAVHDHTEVHRVVLPYRAWDLLGIIGKEQAHTLLRQSVRYCVKAEGWNYNAEMNEPKALLPRMLEEHKLLGRIPGTRQVDDAWVDEFSQTLFKSTGAQAAEAMANALADGVNPAALGEAITLAANQLVLRDIGRTAREEITGKPIGSVHGDSIGVHASDSANAWRNMARLTNSRNTYASLILGAYQVAMDRTNRGGDFPNWKPLPLQQHLDQVKATDQQTLLRDAEEAIRGNLQAHAAAIVHRYGALGHPARPVFDLLLRYAISEDGALHAEKFYRTVSEEFASTREAFRWRHLVALTRVTASEFGRPAAGMDEARFLLKLQSGPKSA